MGPGGKGVLTYQLYVRINLSYMSDKENKKIAKSIKAEK